MSMRRVGLVAVLLALTACADWTGTRDVEFDDPYIRELETERPDGWLGRISLYRAYAYVDRAFRLEAEGRLDDAAAEIARYLDRHPEDVRVRAYHVSLLSRLGRPEQVVEEASRLLEAVPDFVPALMARGRARAALGEPGRAVDDVLAASRAPSVRPPDRADALALAARYGLEHATTLEEQGRWEEAEAAYTRALDLALNDGQRVRALRGRGRTAAELGRVAEARDDLDVAAAIRPGDPALRIEAAELALAASDPEGAIPHLEAVVAMETSEDQRRWALNRLADAYQDLGLHGRAVTQLEALIAMGPGEQSLQELHVRAGELSRGQPARAAAHLEAAARLTDGASRARLLARAAEFYRAAGRDPEAVEALRAAVAADPSNSLLRARLGQALVQAGRHEEAVGPLERALAQDTGRAGLPVAERSVSRLALAAAHEEAGRIDAAMELYRLVVEDASSGSPARTRALGRLAELHAGRGEHRQAADRMMALHRETGDPDGRWAERAANNYALAGAWREAASAYHAAIATGALPGTEGARSVGVALFEAGSYAEAEEALRSIPPQERTGQDLRYLAALAREAGDTVRAIGLYERALDSASTPRDSAFVYRSIGYMQLGRNDTAAVTALDRALEIQPDAGARLDLARAQLRLGRPDAALRSLEAVSAEPGSGHALQGLDLTAEIQAERGDSAAVAEALEAAAEQEPTTDRLNRLGFYYEATGDYGAAASAFERAYDTAPSALQATRVAYMYRRTGDEIRAALWFRRSIDAAAAGEDTAAVDLDAVRQEVALLTDRLALAAYVSYRGDRETAGPLPGGGVAQAGVASQGGLEVRVMPLVQVTPWGREVDVFGRLFWGFEDGLRVDSDSYQGQLGVRYRPRFVSGTALGVERWIGLGSAARDLWALRLQASRLVGRPYPEPDAGASVFVSLYGDVAHLFDDAGTYTLYGEARPGVAIPLSPSVALLPHGTFSAYRQDPGGPGQSYIEGGPGVGLRLRFAREGRYTKDFWSLQLMGQYRWGVFPDFWDAGGDSYDELVLTLVLRL